MSIKDVNAAIFANKFLLSKWFHEFFPVFHVWDHSARPVTPVLMGLLAGLNGSAARSVGSVNDAQLYTVHCTMNTHQSNKKC